MIFPQWSHDGCHQSFFLHIVFFCTNLVLAFPPPVWINLCTCRVKYSMWRWETHVFDKELDTKLLKSQNTQYIFSSTYSVCSGYALEGGLDMVGKHRLPWSDQIFPQRCLRASSCGVEPHTIARGYFLISKVIVGGVVGRAGIADPFPVFPHRS